MLFTSLLVANFGVLHANSPAELRELYSHQPWDSGFPIASGNEDDELALPIELARARWQSMSDAERAAMMGNHRRAFIRGGLYIEPPPEPEPAEAEERPAEEEGGDQKKQHEKKPAAKPAAKKEPKAAKKG